MSRYIRYRYNISKQGQVHKSGGDIVDLGDFRNRVEFLRNNSDKEIDSLSEEVRGVFSEVQKMLTGADGQAQQLDLINIIREVFKDNAPVKFNTVGSYLYGCLDIDYNQPGGIGCAIPCAGSMGTAVTDQGVSFRCGYSVVYSTRPGYFEIMNPNAEMKHQAIIYFQVGTQRGFTTKQVESLKQKGITHGRVFIVGTHNEKYKIVEEINAKGGEFRVLEDFITHDESLRGYKAVDKAGKPKKGGKGKKKGSWSWGWWIFIIFIILLLIIGACWCR